VLTSLVAWDLIPSARSAAAAGFSAYAAIKLLQMSDRTAEATDKAAEACLPLPQQRTLCGRTGTWRAGLRESTSNGSRPPPADSQCRCGTRDEDIGLDGWVTVTEPTE
jgi:hypothetical protein